MIETRFDEQLGPFAGGNKIRKRTEEDGERTSRVWREGDGKGLGSVERGVYHKLALAVAGAGADGAESAGMR